MVLARLVVAFGHCRAGVPPVQLLGARGDEGLEAVVGQDLGVDLEVVVVQRGLVLGRRRRDADARAAGQGPGEDVLDAVRAPPPQLVLDDRAAGVEAVVLDVLDLVGVQDAEGLQLGRDVGGLEEGVGQVEAAGQAHPVAAAAGDHVQRDAAGLNGNIGRAARRDVQLFEHVEVVVQGRAAEGRRVGDVDAVDRPGVVSALVARYARAGRVALGDEARLLAGLVAADVLAVDHDGRGQLHDDPGVSGRGQGLQGFLVDVLPDGRLLGLDDGRFRDDRDLLFESPDLHDQVDLDVRADLEDDAGLGGFLEAGQLGRDLVCGAGGEGHEPVDPRRPGDRRQSRYLGALQGDAHAGEDVAFRVRDLSVDVSRSDLRRQRDREQQHGQNDEELPHE